MGEDWSNNKLFKWISFDFFVLLIVGAFGMGVVYTTLGSDIEKNTDNDVRLQVFVDENKDIASRVNMEVRHLQIDVAEIKAEQRASKAQIDQVLQNQKSQSDKLDRLIERWLGGNGG